MADREKLARILFNSPSLSTLYNSFSEFEEAADHLISNGVVVREKGEWEVEGEYACCSNCGREVARDWSMWFNFCPNCGADMRKGENDG